MSDSNTVPRRDGGNGNGDRGWKRMRLGLALSLGVAVAAGAALWTGRGPLPASAKAAPRAAAGSLQPLASATLRGIATPALRFEANLGQAAPEARYVARGADFAAEVFDDGVRVSRYPRRGADGAPATVASARLRFVGAAPARPIDPRERAAGSTNYLVGSDSSRWLRDVPSWRQLRQAAIYPGIDLVYYGRDSLFEYDLVVQPGVDPAKIRIAVAGDAKPVIDAQGDLLLDGAEGALRMHRPVLYQHVDGKKKVFAGEYVLLATNEVGFRLPEYDRSRPLVIDPTFKLLYSTYVGGVHDDQVGGIVLDAQNNAYVVGNSGSEDFPVSGNAYQSSRRAIGQYVRNVVVAKFDASGTLVYSTFIGGTVNDYGVGIAVDASGRASITGYTDSPDFPVTANAFQATKIGGRSTYLATLSSDGSALAYSTYYSGTGGSGAANVFIEPGGTLLIGGTAGPGLPTTAGAYKTTLAAGNAVFVARFDTAAAGAAQLVAATYWGTDAPQANFLGSGVFLYTMALDAAGSPWATGQAYTANLPVSANPVVASPTAMTPGCSPGQVPLNSFAYVVHLSTDLKSLVYASYLTGRNGGQTTCAEYGHGIAFDTAGNVFVGGSTSSLLYPTTAGVPQPVSPANSGFDGYTGFITKIKADGSAILWSTYLGGNAGRTYLTGLLTDPAGALWMYASSAGGSNFPITSDALQGTHGGGAFDISLTRLDPNTAAVQYSSFLGGSGDDYIAGVALDSSGNAYLAGASLSANFPVSPNAFQPALTTPAYDGADWFFSILGTGTISRLSTTSAGNGGDVTLTLDGAGFVDGAACALADAASSRAATSVRLVAGGGQLVCTFALAGATPGVFDVVVTLPDGSVLRKNASFTIVAGGQPEVWASVVGRPKIRVGVPTRFTVNVGNSGNADAWFSVVRVVVNSDMTYTLPNPLRPLGAASGADYQARATTADVDSGLRYLSFVVPLIPVGKTLAVPIDLTSLGAQTYIVSATANLPWFDDRSSAEAALRAAVATVPPASCQPVAGKAYLSNCLGSWVDIVAAEAASTTSTLSDSGGSQDRANPSDKSAYAKQFAQGLLDALGASSGASAAPTVRLPAFSVAGSLVVGLQASAMFLNDVAFDGAQGAGIGAARIRVQAAGGKQAQQFGGCVPGIALFPQPWRQTYWGQCIGGTRVIDDERDYSGHDLLFFACTGVEKRRRYEPCDDTPIPSYCKWTPHAQGQSAADRKQAQDSNGTSCGGSGGSIDPNDKSGPLGDGSASHFVRAVAPLSYQIAFENLPTASLPAAEVVITDQLDPAKVDLSTLTLGSISFGDTTIDVPPGLKSYSTVQPIDATMSVRVQGSVDLVTGLLRWTFQTIDPATHLPPSDATLGFLPPDTDGRRGQGTVLFTVAPRRTLGAGATISNLASVVFDSNAAIVTPTWVNRLDDTRPTSRVTTLTRQDGSAAFDVAWSGSDADSGIGVYTVYVSDNGGPFSAWKSNVTASSASYPGELGHTYGFYAIATDGAGNVEAAKVAAEASITAGPASASSGGGGCTLGGDGQRDATLPLLVLAATALAFIGRRRGATTRRRRGEG